MIFTQTYFQDKIYYVYTVIIIQTLNVFFSEPPKSIENIVAVSQKARNRPNDLSPRRP